MASGTLTGMSRYLHDLFHGGTAVGLGDGQLLARYAATRDEAAFAALVARHGPMVLSTCRAVLRHEPDAEDAFQATFLVLARRAHAVRAGEALGGWLHRVAYRVAIEAGGAARRRQRREAEVAAMTPLHTTSSDPEPDLAAVVHEELDRLPDRERLPVVLCDLEGLTHEQAAARLGWTGPTLRHRLEKGRRRLRERLTRRGIRAGAVGTILAGTTAGARAAVPAALAQSAVSTAATGTAPAAVAALASGIIRGMALGRLGLVAAAVALLSVGVVALGSWRPEPPGAAAVPQAVGEMKTKRPTSAKDVPAPAPAETIEVRGRVVDPRGRPVAGVPVRVFQLARGDRPEVETTSGPDGRFSLRVHLRGLQLLLKRPGIMFPWVVASASGFGPGWASAVPERGASGEVTIRLVEDGPPIEGRIVDLEGRPVAGARIKVEQLWFSREGSLADWLARAADSGVEGPFQGLQPLPANLAATADRDGRFRLTGIGRDRLAEVLVSGPTTATTQLRVANRDGTTLRATNPRTLSPARYLTAYYPRRFEYAALPSRPIEGFLRDKDTGRPIAGAKLQGMAFERGSLVPARGVEATTDAQGHYRLTGLPVGPSYRLFVEPAAGQPYPHASLVTPTTSPRPEPIAFDMTLRRGVLVRGRMTDRATGRPVSGYVTPYTFSDNPIAREFPGYAESDELYAPVGDDGRYEVVALPGRGILAGYAIAGHYRRGVGAQSIRHGFEPVGNSAGAFSTMPGLCLIEQYHVLAEIDIPAGAEVVTEDLQVEPGRTVMIHVEDPEGRALGGTTARGLSDLATTFEVPQDSPTIEVHGLDALEPRRVIIRHEGRKLMGAVMLKGDEAGPLTVRLQAYGTITGRVVDEDGRPRGGLSLTSLGGFGTQARADQGVLPGAENGLGLRIGRDGRFRIEGLIPGLKYGAQADQGRMSLGEVFRDVVVAPGEVRDLGDLKVVERKPGG